MIPYIGSTSTLLPLAFFLIFKRKNKEKSLKVILFYIIYCILNEVLLLVFSYLRSKNGIFITFASFTVFEFSFFCLFYRYALPVIFVKNSILILWLIFLIFATIDFFYINKEHDFDSLTTGIENIVIIILCIYYIAAQLRGSYSLSVYSTFDFWVIISFLIYLSGTLFLYIMAENMLNDKKFQMQYNVINAAFNLLKNILLSVAMLMKPASNGSKNQLSKTDLDNLFSLQLKN